MDKLKEAVVEGGAKWKTGYPIICAAVIQLLEQNDFRKSDALTTREIQNDLLDQTGLPDNAAYRRVVYKCITANAKPGLLLADYHSRIAEPDPTREGKTRMAYRWHVPDIATLISHKEGEIFRAKLELAHLKGELKDLEAKR